MRANFFKPSAIRIGDWWWRTFQDSLNLLKKLHNLFYLDNVPNDLIK